MGKKSREGIGVFDSKIFFVESVRQLHLTTGVLYNIANLFKSFYNTYSKFLATLSSDVIRVDKVNESLILI